MDIRKWKIIIVAVIGICIIGIAFGIYQIIPSKKQMDLNTYFKRSSEDEVGLVVNDQILEAKGIKEEGMTYLPLNEVQQYLSSRFYWDGEALFYMLPTEVLQVFVGDTTYTIAGVETRLSNDILIQRGDDLYLCVDFIVTVYSAMNRSVESDGYLWIWDQWEEDVVVKSVEKNSAVRYEKSIKSPIVESIEKGDNIYILSEEDGWSKVQTENGLIGYVKTNRLQEEATSKLMEGEYTTWDYTSITREEPVVMAWQQNLNDSGINNLDNIIERTKGVLNTISPSWFTVTDEVGNFESRGSKEYVEKAHENGIEVWAMIDNINISIDSHKLLSSTDARTNLIHGLMEEAKRLGIDGINLDFEKIKPDTGIHYIQFIRELSVACRNANIVLSVDNYVPSTSTQYYDRKEQGIVADYVIIMGYDEHWAGGLEAGSTASKSFVEKGIKDTLEEVPNNKVINAIPFYTRLWCETPANISEPNAKIIEDENSKYRRFSLSSEAKGMKSSRELLEEKNITPIWDEEIGQYYAEYEESNQFYKIWLEEETSMREKLEIIDSFNIAGISAWKLGLEEEYVWGLIGEYF